MFKVGDCVVRINFNTAAGKDLFNHFGPNQVYKIIEIIDEDRINMLPNLGDDSYHPKLFKFIDISILGELGD